MRASQFLIHTVKETPADAVVISHQLMLRSGMIRKLASGLYSWLPLGLKILRKAENIIREEMDRTGAMELLMPAIQPAELWQESGRWEQFGPELLRLHDRHNREFCVGPTHEEVITDIARNDLKSYKQLPVNYYQIQTKFRDEVRPRFGVMRSREFIMKDAYSFHLDQESLQQTYDNMYVAYDRIFSRMGLEFRAVQADSGSIGGSQSQEFHVLAESGEDLIAFSDSGEYAANVETAEALAPTELPSSLTASMESVATPGQKTIADLCTFLNIEPEETIKTLIVEANKESGSKLLALVLRGDHTLNELKVEKLAGVKLPVQFATEEVVRQELNCSVGSLGPVGLTIPIIVDRSAAALTDFVCGANREDEHLTGVNWERDCQFQETADIRQVESGDPSPDGNGQLLLKRGIEVGHIFQLGQKYAEAMKATVLDENGKSKVMTMGCYGIGVTRVVAAAIEQNNDDRGIIWPPALAPFTVGIVAINYDKSERVRQSADSIYDSLVAEGVEVYLDDRVKTSPGVKFADMELIGLPHRLVVGDKGLERGVIEYRKRDQGSSEDFETDDAVDKLLARLKIQSV